MDAIGEDAVSDTGACLEQLLEIPIQLSHVDGDRQSVPHTVGLELDAGVVDVEIHPARVTDPRWPFGRLIGEGSDASGFHEALESSSDVVL